MALRPSASPCINFISLIAKSPSRNLMQLTRQYPSHCANLELWCGCSCKCHIVRKTKLPPTEHCSSACEVPNRLIQFWSGMSATQISLFKQLTLLRELISRPAAARCPTAPEDGPSVYGIHCTTSGWDLAISPEYIDSKQAVAIRIGVYAIQSGTIHEGCGRVSCRRRHRGYAGTDRLVNGKAETMFGYARCELDGQRIEVLIPDRYRDRHAIHRDAYKLSPHTRMMGLGSELVGLRKNGREFPVEISLSPAETDTGTLIVSMVHDITARKHIEDELKQSEERYRSLFENASFGAFRCTPDWKIIDANPALVAMLGYDNVEQVRGLNVREHIDKDIERKRSRRERNGYGSLQRP